MTFTCHLEGTFVVGGKLSYFAWAEDLGVTQDFYVKGKVARRYVWQPGAFRRKYPTPARSEWGGP